MTARKLKVERVGPKAWKFECAPEEYCLMEKFDSAVDLMEAGNEEEAEKILRAIIQAWPLHIDAHHTVEDVGIVLGEAVAKALHKACGLVSLAAQLLGCSVAAVYGQIRRHPEVAEAAQLASERELDAARAAHSADPHIAALLRLSNEIAENNGDVSRDGLQSAREHGVTDEEIGEVVANLALNVLTNYFNLLAEVDNDWPVVSLSAVAAAS